MDTSKEYIKMCEKAVEIQTVWKPQNGDFCWHDNEGEEVYGCWEYPEQITTVSITQATERDWWGNWLWLPRQDELQEIIDDWWKKNGNYGEPLIKGLYDFATSLGYKPFRENELPIKSWEQLWLAFVMKQKYNKEWVNEDWVELKDD